jgi:hypothetical protein
MEEKVASVLRMIDCMGFPNKMSRDEWKEFLVSIRDGVDERLQASIKTMGPEAQSSR